MKAIVVFLSLGCFIQVSPYSKDAIESISQERLSSLLKTCSIAIYDEIHAEFISTMSSVIERQQMMISNHHVYKTLVPLMENLMKHASLEQMRNQLQFLVVCEVTCIQPLFADIDYLDRVVGQGSLLRHFSSWMIVSTSDPQSINTTVDNVVWIVVNKITPTLSPTNVEYFKDSQSQIRGIYTCLWMPDRREWSKVLQDNQDQFSFNEHLFPNKRRGLNGREIILATMQWTGYAIREVIDGKLHYKGIGFDMVDNLKTKFNFSYIIVEPKDNLWGQELENGTYNGVLGMLQRKEADLCPVPYSLALKRHLAMDYSSLIDASEQMFLYKKTPDVAVSWLFLASSFSWPVYLCGAGSLLWVTLVVFALQYSRNKRHGELFIRLFQYMSVHIPFRQDIQLIPKFMSSRIMIFSWSIFCLMFAAVYTSNLVAFITVDRNKAPFNTLEELAYDTDYKIVTVEGTHAVTAIKESNDSALRTIYERLLVLTTSANASFGETENRLLKKALSGNYALLTPLGIGKELMSKSCELEANKKRFFQRNSGLAFPKNSPLKKYFDKQLLNMVEMGLVETFIKKWFPKEKLCRPVGQLHTFSLNHFKSGLIVVVGGMVSAGCLLVFEKFAFR